MLIKRRYSPLSGAAVLALSVNLSGVTTACAAGAAEPAASDTLTVTETITARKQTEEASQIPVATTVIPAAQLPSAASSSAAEIARQSPGTVFTDLSRFGDGYMTMRGIATLSSAQNPLDSTVGFATDGIPTTLSGLNAPLLDVDHIEVLEGSQSTTFGRNALAGAINVVTRPADGTRQFRLETETGSHGYGFAQATAGGWLVPGDVAGRAVVRFQQFGGDIPNAVIGGKDGASNVNAARGSLRFTPNDTLTVDVSGNYSRNRNHNPSNILLEADDFPTSGQDTRPLNQQDIASGSVKFSKVFDALTFTSVTSYQDVRIKAESDYTDSLLFGAVYAGLYGPAYRSYFENYFADAAQDNIRYHDREKLFDQEFRISSWEGDPITWVAGANYFRSDYHLNREMQTSAWPTLNGNINNSIASQTVSMFGDVTVPIADRLDLSGGLRLAHDHQTLDADYQSNGFPGTVAAFSQRDSWSDTYLTGRVALAWHWTDKVMSWASLSRGYASGGYEKLTQYAPYGIEAAPFKPSTTWTWELGSKAQLNDWLRLNGVLFYNDVKDGQVAAFDTATLANYYASQDYRSYGVEGSATVTPIGGLDLHGGVSLIRSEQVNVTDTSAAAGAVAGNRVPQVPSFAATAGVQYRFSLPQLSVPGEFSAGVNYQYVGTRYSDIANSGRLKPYDIVNARLGWSRDALSLYLFANNLLDERPVWYAIPVTSGVSASYVGRGRILGLGVSLDL